MRRRSLAAAAACLVLAALAAGCSYDDDIARPIAASAAAQSSKIYAADGTLLTTLHAEENREVVPLAKMSKRLQDSVVAIEDRRFWEHKGVDVRSVLRAAYENTSRGGVVEGGSTITQQYVKNSTLDDDRTLHRKIKEASLAYQLERHYSKRTILEGYLNTIYFGNGAYGAQAAASVYFATTADTLTLGQSAVLAGIIRSPRRYDPYRNPETALRRRDEVLDAVLRSGWATADEVAAAKAQPLGVSPRPNVAHYPAAHFVEEVKQFVLDDPAFGDTPAERQAALFTGGLRIETTLDPKRQFAAEAAIGRVLVRPDTDPDAALVSLDPDTGEVRALVGGRDFFGTSKTAKFDLAAQGGRPAGSSFKPLVLAAALQAGFPLTRQYDAPATLTIPLPGTAPWEVSNYEDEAGGRLDLVEATVHSINTVYAQLILDVGPDKAVGLARRMGIRSPLAPNPSAVLGTNDVTPLDMAAAYATLANRGVRVDPVLVTRVTRADGTVVWQHQRVTQRVLPRQVADAVTAVLQQVVLRGTGVRANIGRPVAGKTGTGQQWRDAWFVGYTPDLATSVWVGFPQGEIPMVPPTTRIRVTGGSWPAQIWQLYTSTALAEVPVTNLPPPPPLPGVPGAVGTDAAPVAIPDVLGRGVDEAEALLRAGGLNVVRQPIADGERPPGTVVGQSPRGGEQVPAGSAVTLSVATGSAAVAVVPDALGLTAAEAQGVLRDAGFIASIVVTPEPPSPGAAGRRGRVWRQSPAAGSKAPAGSTVTVAVNPGG